MTPRTTLVALVALVALVTAAVGAGSARADPDVAATAEATATPDADFHTHLVGDVRGVLLVRSDDNYFHQATKFGYDYPAEAGGIAMTVGAAILPRLSLLAEGLYVEDGSNRGLAKIRLASGALLGVARVTIVRTGTKDVSGELAATAGLGRYYLRETYVDAELSPMVYSKYGGSFGGAGGLEGSVTAGAFRAALVYAYHYAPATVDDRIRGSVEAGGHEISIALGVSL